MSPAHHGEVEEGLQDTSPDVFLGRTRSSLASVFRTSTTWF